MMLGYGKKNPSKEPLKVKLFKSICLIIRMTGVPPACPALVNSRKEQYYKKIANYSRHKGTEPGFVFQTPVKRPSGQALTLIRP